MKLIQNSTLWLLGGFMLPLISACSAEDVETNYSLLQQSNSKGNFKISITDALATADEFFNQTESNTRSNKRNVESINVIKSVQTRSGSNNSDTLLYLVNYSENAGFALLGSDSRMERIYAIAPEGHFAMSDTTGKPLLSSFIQSAEIHAATALGFEPVYPDSIKSTIVIKEKISSKIYTNAQKWDQVGVFNTYTFTNKGEQSFPGCVPTAFGIVMSYFRWPSQIGGTQLNWSDMLDSKNNLAVAKMFHLMGTNAFNVNYTTIGGNVMPWQIIPGIQKLAYATHEAYCDVPFKDNLNNAITLLRIGGISSTPAQPFMVTGTQGTSGHAFVVDGYVARVRGIIKNDGSIALTPNECPPLFHIVWGYGGAFNGYYTYLAGESRFDTQEVEQNGSPMPNCKFPVAYTNLLMYGGIKPLK